jgi:hypothetical protein
LNGDLDRSGPLPQRESTGTLPRPFEPAPRLPALHRPYLVATALFGILAATLPFVRLTPATTTAWLAILLACTVLHVAWLWVVFRDARQALGDELPIDGVRVVIMGLLSCVLVYLVTAMALLLLCRIAARSAMRRDPMEGAELARLGQTAPALVFGALLYNGAVLYDQVKLLAHARLFGDAAPLSSVDVLGSANATLLALLGLVTTAFYLSFVARTLPALYRSFQKRAPAAAA